MVPLLFTSSGIQPCRKEGILFRKPLPNQQHHENFSNEKQLVCLFVTSRIDCFNQEERVAGQMSEVCPFLKEIKSRDRDRLRSLVQSKWYLRACSGHRVLFSLNCLSTMVVKAGIVTGDTL